MFLCLPGSEQQTVLGWLETFAVPERREHFQPLAVDGRAPENGLSAVQRDTHLRE